MRICDLAKNCAGSAGLTSMVDRLIKSVVSKLKGPLAKVYNIFITVIGLNYTVKILRGILSRQPFSNFARITMSSTQF